MDQISPFFQPNWAQRTGIFTAGPSCPPANSNASARSCCVAPLQAAPIQARRTSLTLPRLCWIWWPPNSSAEDSRAAVPVLPEAGKTRHLHRAPGKGGLLMAGQFELVDDAGGGYRARLTDKTGELLALSEKYNTTKAAARGIQAIREIAASGLIEDRSASPAAAGGRGQTVP